VQHVGGFQREDLCPSVLKVRDRFALAVNPGPWAAVDFLQLCHSLDQRHRLLAEPLDEERREAGPEDKRVVRQVGESRKDRAETRSDGGVIGLEVFEDVMQDAGDDDVLWQPGPLEQPRDVNRMRDVGELGALAHLAGMADGRYPERKIDPWGEKSHFYRFLRRDYTLNADLELLRGD